MRAYLMALPGIFMSIINTGFLLIVFILFLMYKRTANLERGILGQEKMQLSNRIIRSIIMGTIGGAMVTFVIIALGISIELTGFFYLFILAVILMSINPRYLCFSYSGGLICLSSLIFGVPRIDVTGIMAIVAILHLTESFLMFMDGSYGSSPVFMESQGHGVIGGHLMQRFWPIPFVILTVTTGTGDSSGTISMPSWWPILHPAIENMENMIFAMSPIVAILGYGDMALSGIPKEKVKTSALRLFVYSVILLGLAIVSSYLYIFKFIAAIFAPLAHELLIIYSNREEKSKKPLFAAGDYGVRVLDVVIGGIAYHMGMKPGDLIISVNGTISNTQYDIYDILSENPTYVWVDAVDYKGEKKRYHYRQYPTAIANLGIIYVPRDGNVPLVKSREGFLARFIKSIFRKY
jgi:hypothetical protein